MKNKKTKEKEKRFISRDELRLIQSSQQGMLSIDMTVAARVREIASLNMRYANLVEMSMQHSRDLKTKYSINDNESIDINTGEILLQVR